MKKLVVAAVAVVFAFFVAQSAMAEENFSIGPAMLEAEASSIKKELEVHYVDVAFWKNYIHQECRRWYLSIEETTRSGMEYPSRKRVAQEILDNFEKLLEQELPLRRLILSTGEYSYLSKNSAISSDMKRAKDYFLSSVEECQNYNDKAIKTWHSLEQR